jgi:type IV secretory pathway TraG/TraD family ATPase VirD4
MWWLPWAIAEASLVTGLARTRVDWSNSRKYFWSPVVSLLTTLAADIGVWGFGISGDSWLHLPARTAAIVGMGYLAGKLWARKPPEGATSIKRERGTEIRDPPPPQPPQALGKARDQRITLAGVPLELKDEVKHFKVIGTTGAGKTTAITEMLEKALARGDRVIIADPNGDYMSRFYDPTRGDLILNPFRQDSVPWSLLGEIREPKDIENMALAFLPNSGGSETRIWNEHGRTFFQAVTKQLLARAANGAAVATDAELYRLLSAPVDELRGLLQGTAAQSFVEEGNERFFGSVRSTTTTAFKALEHIIQQRGPALSVRDWVEQGNQPGKSGILFMPYLANEPALQPMISAWMRTAIYETLSQPPNEDRRLWFVVDELAAVGAIDGMIKAMAELRKHGGRMVIGFQSIAQVRATYGEAEANTIVENARNTLILNSASSEHGGTAEFASRIIGDAEVTETTYSHTLGATDWIGSTTKSQRFAMKRVVLPSEIEQLRDLYGYLKFASNDYWMKVKLSLRDIKSKYATAAPSVSPAPVSSASPSSTAAAAPAAAPTPPAASAPPSAAVPATTSKSAGRVTKRKAGKVAAAQEKSAAKKRGPRSPKASAAESKGGLKDTASGQKSQNPGDQTSGSQQSGQQSLPLGPAAAPAAAAAQSTGSIPKSPPPRSAGVGRGFLSLLPRAAVRSTGPTANSPPAQGVGPRSLPPGPAASPAATAAPSTAPTSKSPPAQAVGPRKRRAGGSATPTLPAAPAAASGSSAPDATPSATTAGSPDPKRADSSDDSAMSSSRSIPTKTYRSLRVQEIRAEQAREASLSVPSTSSAGKQTLRTQTSTAAPPSRSSLARGDWEQGDTFILSHRNLADARENLTQREQLSAQEIQDRAAETYRAGKHDQLSSSSAGSTQQDAGKPDPPTQSQGYDHDMGMT